MRWPSKAIIYKIACGKIAYAVVFITLIYICPRIISIYDAHWYAPNEIPKRGFYIAFSGDRSEQQLELAPYQQAVLKKMGPLEVPQDMVRKTSEFETIEYHVLEQSNGESVIETIKSDDDYSFITRYRVKDGYIIPMMDRVFGPGHVFTGIALAVLFCSLFFYILRRISRPKEA